MRFPLLEQRRKRLLSMMSFLEILCDSSVMPHGSSLDSVQTITIDS